MSGTSADGVDVALVRIEGRVPAASCQLLFHWHRAYDPLLRANIARLRTAQDTTLRELAELSRHLALVYAAAVNEALIAAGLSALELSAVAAHGQTLFHDPPLTLQWLDPALLAAEVGCAVISDFRRADCAAGGQGAPLVPWADHQLFAHPQRNRLILNIGGIANLTWLPAGAGLEQVLAFDTGPGNCISDHLMRQRCRRPFDLGGDRALRGRPRAALVRRFLANPWFSQNPPRSTDGPAMIALWQRSVRALRPQPRLDDLLSSACLATASAIGESIERYLPARPDEVIASGGGTRNAATMNFLRQALGRTPLRLSDELGVPSAAREAMAFALLAAATLDGQPSNVPSATGARRPVVLGCVTPKP